MAIIQRDGNTVTAIGERRRSRGRRNIFRFLGVAISATVLLFAVSITAFAAGNWTPWDGNHITTKAKCMARLNYIAKTYNVAKNALRCQAYSTACGPGGTIYYVLEIDTDRARASSTPDDYSLASAIPAVASC
jgi:hypothetical protein